MISGPSSENNSKQQLEEFKGGKEEKSGLRANEVNRLSEVKAEPQLPEDPGGILGHPE